MSGVVSTFFILEVEEGIYFKQFRADFGGIITTTNGVDKASRYETRSDALLWLREIQVNYELEHARIREAREIVELT